MKQDSQSMKATLETLRQTALRHPDVEVCVACEGTSIESASFKVRGKAFLFLRPVSAMVKLKASRAEAERLAEQSPSVYKTGASGWATITLATLDGVGLKRARSWIAESYTLFASEPSSPAKSPKKPAQKPNRKKA